jgi:thiamine biosynthesis lipoprotein
MFLLICAKSRLLVPAFLCLLLAACSGPDAALQLSGSTMGTSYNLTWIAAADSPGQASVQVAVENELERINASMSTYREDSEISKFNATAVGEWFPVSEDFMAVFLLAREVSSASGGAYDVTVGPLVNLWGFGPQMGDVVPAEADIAIALAQVGESWLEVKQLTLRKKRPLELDFSSIAKGYGVDILAGWFDQHGLSDYLVEIGGEVRVSGNSPRGGPWRIAVEKPEALQRELMATLAISNVAVATSGDYRNFFERDGVRYSHSIDPRTGRPVQHELVSVTVVHESTALADAWATALTVLGPQVALETARREQLSVLLISRVGEVFRVEKTPAIEPWLE